MRINFTMRLLTMGKVFVAVLTAVSFGAGHYCGSKDGANKVKEDITSTALLRIGQHKNNLRNQTGKCDDVLRYGWTIAEAKYRNQSIGKMKAYGQILREVTR